MKSVIIDRLIQIEESARDITKELSGREEQLPVLLQKECAEIEKKLKAECEDKSVKVRETKEKECAKRLAELESESTARLKKLDDYFAQNHKAWENDIFNSIIGR